MNVDVRIESADLNSALRTYIKRRLHFAFGRFAGTLGRVGVRSRMSSEPAIFRTPPIASELSYSRPDERCGRRRLTGIAIDLATERIARTFERELDRARSVGAVRNLEAAASQPRRRRFK
jgi:hypothetical protein